MNKLFQWISKNEYFLSLVLTFIGFGWFFISELGQNTSCGKGNLFMCPFNGLGSPLPDMLRHSIYYDIFFLRAGASFGGSHWFSQLVIPICFYVVILGTKDPKFAFLTAIGVMGFHEFIYNFFFYSAYPYDFNLHGGEIGVSIFLALLGVFCVVLLWAYPKIYRRKEFFFIVIMPYVIYLFYWFFAWNMRVTIQVANATPYYFDPVTNMLEVIGWWLLYSLFMIYGIIFYKQHEKIIKQERGGLLIGKSSR